MGTKRGKTQETIFLQILPSEHTALCKKDTNGEMSEGQLDLTAIFYRKVSTKSTNFHDVRARGSPQPANPQQSSRATARRDLICGSTRDAEKVRHVPGSVHLDSHADHLRSSCLKRRAAARATPTPAPR